MSVETGVAGHYTQGTLEQRILAALREAGKDLDRLDPVISHRWTSSTMLDGQRPRPSRLD